MTFLERDRSENPTMGRVVGRLAKLRFSCSLAAVGFALTASSAFGSIITNAPVTLNIGSGSVGSVFVNGNASTGCIVWGGGGISPTACTNGFGQFQVGSPAPPAPFAVGQVGSIEDLFGATATPPQVGFITIPAANNATFDLISIFAPSTTQGNCTSGPSCQFAGSPFLLTQQGSNVGIQFSVTLEGYTGTSGLSYNAATPYTGTFTTQLTNTSIAAIINTFATPGGSIVSSWSATLQSSATPEPGTFGLLGGALLGLGAVIRRRVNKA